MKKKTRNIVAVLFLSLATAFAAYADGGDGKDCKKSCCKKSEQTSCDKSKKEHVCTDACKKAGHCVYACGEKGHTCTDACKH